MRILHVIDSLDIGGAERMLVEIANGAAADGLDVSVCVTRSVSTLAGNLHPAIEFSTLNRHHRVDIPSIRRLAADIDQRGIDVCHAHGRTTFSLMAAARTLRLTHIPVVFHDHVSVDIDPAVPRWFAWWGRHHVAEYVGVYAALANWAASAGIPRERIHIIENALDLSRFEIASAPRETTLRQRFGIPDELLLGVVVGGIRPEKGIDVLLKALAQTRHRQLCKIVLIGGERDASYAAGCRRLCSFLGLDQNVIFAGQCTDAAALLSQVDFALLPSRCESGPLVLIEYMAAGIPFVATRVGSVGGRLASLGAPGLVGEGDVYGLALAIDDLLQLTPQQRRERGKLGRETARRYFDIRQAMPQWYAVYDTALQCKHGRQR